MKCYCVTEYGAPLQLIERATPVPTGTEVVLKVKAAGVCHTDLHIWEGGYDMGGGKMMRMSDRGQTLPHTMGHETVGEVIAAGPAAKDVRAGDIRLVYPWIGCGECAVCKADTEQLCLSPRYLGVFRPGGYADHIVVPHPRYLIEIGRLAPPAAAPYACSGLTAFSAIKKIGAHLDQPILVIGAGGVGLQCLSLIGMMGGRGAIVADIDPVKREAALAAGALAVADPRDAAAMATIAAACNGPLYSVIDFVGASATWTFGLGALSKGGTYVMVGLFGGEVMQSLPAIPLRALSILGSFVGSRPELIELLDMVNSHPTLQIPIRTRPFDEVNEALIDLRDGKQVGRGVLVSTAI